MFQPVGHTCTLSVTFTCLRQMQRQKIVFACSVSKTSL